MKYILSLFVVLFLVSCDEKMETLDEGFEWIGNEGRSHFMYVAKSHYGDKVAQREAGKIVCTHMFKHEDYCEIYMWSTREDVPTSLPIINRRTMIGKFRMKNGEMILKPLRD